MGIMQAREGARAGLHVLSAIPGSASFLQTPWGQAILYLTEPLHLMVSQKGESV